MAQRFYKTEIYRDENSPTTYTYKELPLEGLWEDHVQRVTILDDDTNGITALIGVVRDNVFTARAQIAAVNADVLGVWEGSEFVIQEGEHLEIRLSGITANDAVTMTVEGYKWEGRYDRQ